MTAPGELLAVLGLALVVGFVWAFRNGGPLTKTAVVVVAVYMTATTGEWWATDRALHPIEAQHGLGVAAMLVVGLLVLRYAAPLVPVFIVAGCLILAGDLGNSITTGLGR